MKAIALGAVLAGSISMVVGSQGTSAGPLMVQAMELADVRFFWSWPIFTAGSGLAWGIMLLQR